MPVTELINSACNFSDPEQSAETLYAHLKARPRDEPGFYFFRIVWVGPSDILKTFKVLRARHPELDWEIVDPYTFFDLFRKRYGNLSGR